MAGLKRDEAGMRGTAHLRRVFEAGKSGKHARRTRRLLSVEVENEARWEEERKEGKEGEDERSAGMNRRI